MHSEPKVLSAEDVAHYQENGFVLVKGFVAPEIVAEIKAQTEELHERLVGFKGDGL
ncbi:MAG: phytanoyl-CoA dioxygenase family protein [Kiritimatiellae bacterium]|nr:phytanoyl-CoA dioxygenase family protein [Kiritimatiellia bacterium]